MAKQDRYKIEVKWDTGNTPTRKRQVISLPVDKVTDIDWKALVKVIAENGIGIADQIRHHNKGEKGGTNMLERQELWKLWKDVEAFRKASGGKP